MIRTENIVESTLKTWTISNPDVMDYSIVQCRQNYTSLQSSFTLSYLGLGTQTTLT